MFYIWGDKKLRQYFLLASLVVVGVFAFLILRPFMYVVVLALVCAVVFHPLHKRIERWLGVWKSLAALITTVIIVVVILIPFIIVGFKVFQELQQFSVFLLEGRGNDAIIHFSNQAVSLVQKYIPETKGLSIDFDQYVQRGLGWLLNALTYLFASFTKLFFSFFIFLIVVYYLLRDGLKFKEFIIETSPLKDRDDLMIFKKIGMAIHSVIKGTIIIAIIQGILATIGFMLFGVSHPILWGTATALASLIPALGTSVVLVPAVVFLFFTKGIFWAAGLALWGAVIVGLVDNMLKPQLIGRGMRIHPLVIFLSVIGGIAFLGPVGLLIGPLTISLLFALLDIYTSVRTNPLE